MNILGTDSEVLHCGEKVKTLLYYLNNNELQKRIEALITLGNLLSSESKARDYFHEYEGSTLIVHRLRIEKHRKVVEVAFFALACSANNHIENQKFLVNEIIFGLLCGILNHPNVLKFKKMCHSTLLLLSVIVNQNSRGQYLIRESGCLSHLVSMLQNILYLAGNVEDSSKELHMSYLEVICQTLFLSVNNPKNEENQIQVALLFPKALLYLLSIDSNDSKSKSYIKSCMRLFIGTISGNTINQESFVKCGGLLFLKRLLFNSKDSSYEHSLIETCLMLLDVLTTSNGCFSNEVSSLNIIPYLLDVLLKGNFQCKLATLILLFHLMENNKENQEIFIRKNGPFIIEQSAVNGIDNEDLQLVLRTLEETFHKSGKEFLSANISPRHPQELQSSLDDEINFLGIQPEKKLHENESPRRETPSSVVTFDMTSHFNNRLLKHHRDSYPQNKKADLRTASNRTSEKFQVFEKTPVTIKRKLNTRLANLRLNRKRSKHSSSPVFTSPTDSVHGLSTEASSRKIHSLVQEQSNENNSKSMNTLDDNQIMLIQNPSSFTNNPCLNALIGNVNIQISNNLNGLQLNVHVYKSKNTLSSAPISNTSDSKSTSSRINEHDTITQINNGVCYPEDVSNSCYDLSEVKKTSRSSENREVQDNNSASEGLVYSSYRNMANLQESNSKTDLLGTSPKPQKMENDNEKTADYTGLVSYTLDNANEIGDKKDLLIPKGQKKIWNDERESIKQIPLTREEMQNLESGIKTFGLNFIAIRKAYSFLSMRTSKDLFLAWRDGLQIEHPAKKRKMLAISSEGSISSDCYD